MSSRAGKRLSWVWTLRKSAIFVERLCVDVDHVHEGRDPEKEELIVCRQAVRHRPYEVRWTMARDGSLHRDVCLQSKDLSWLVECRSDVRVEDVETGVGPTNAWIVYLGTTKHKTDQTFG